MDSALSDAATAGLQNDGDNELTGIHVSNGDPTRQGILGAQIPRPFVRGSGCEAFYTAQHGNNVTYQLIADRISQYRVTLGPGRLRCRGPGVCIRRACAPRHEALERCTRLIGGKAMSLAVGHSL